MHPKKVLFAPKQWSSKLTHLPKLMVMMLVALSLAACQPVQAMADKQRASADSALTAVEKANKAVVERFYEEVVNQRHPEVIGELFDPSIVFHDLDFGADGLDIGLLLKTMPDVKANVSLLVVKNDLVTTVVTFKGTHTNGELLGVPTTGYPVTFSIIDIWRVNDGKFTELWHNVPNSDILEQLQPVAALPALEPGDKVGEMVVSQGPATFDMSQIPPYPIFCNALPALTPGDSAARPGKYFVNCTVPPLAKLHIGGGWAANNEDLRDEEWSAIHKELFINGQPVDQAAFGSIDVDVPMAGMPGQDASQVTTAKLRVWNVVLENLQPGVLTLRMTQTNDKDLLQGTATMPAGSYDYVYTITVDPNAVVPAGASDPVKFSK
jgi:predicted ester cyclase